MLGTYVLSAGYYDAYYRKAQQVRALLREDFRKAFESCDAIITPTSPTAAFLLGEKVDDPLAMYLNDVYTVTANLAGVPGLNVPCGLSTEQLPIGFQLLGPYWSEPQLAQTRRRLRACSPVYSATAHLRGIKYLNLSFSPTFMLGEVASFFGAEPF